jgi:hypothetical protein
MTDLTQMIRWNTNFVRGLAQSVLDRARVIRGGLTASSTGVAAATGTKTVKTTKRKTTAKKKTTTTKTRAPKARRRRG